MGDPKPIPVITASYQMTRKNFGDQDNWPKWLTPDVIQPDLMGQLRVQTVEGNRPIYVDDVIVQDSKGNIHVVPPTFFFLLTNGGPILVDMTGMPEPTEEMLRGLKRGVMPTMEEPRRDALRPGDMGIYEITRENWARVLNEGFAGWVLRARDERIINVEVNGDPTQFGYAKEIEHGARVTIQWDDRLVIGLNGFVFLRKPDDEQYTIGRLQI